MVSVCLLRPLTPPVRLFLSHSTTSWTPGCCRWASLWSPSTPRLGKYPRNTSCWIQTLWSPLHPRTSIYPPSFSLTFIWYRFIRIWVKNKNYSCVCCSYEWIVPIRWMKNGVVQDPKWLETKSGKMMPPLSYRGCRMSQIHWHDHWALKKQLSLTID